MSYAFTLSKIDYYINLYKISFINKVKELTK